MSTVNHQLSPSSSLLSNRNQKSSTSSSKLTDSNNDNNESANNGGNNVHLTNQLFSDVSIRYNDYLLDYCQTSVSALSGCAAGIMGLTGFYGFGFYLICSLILSMIIFVTIGKNIDKYFISKQNIVTGTLWSGIQTFLLFWTFMFGMVHVY
jgi:ER membrane protein complex subunit 6